MISPSDESHEGPERIEELSLHTRLQYQEVDLDLQTEKEKPC